LQTRLLLRNFTAGNQIHYFDMKTLNPRITINPQQCGGKPCVRNMRIRVTDVLDLLANGLSFSEILEELPDLELPDIEACLQFASLKLNHPLILAS
jgi:uncharacterized protein (DUF433 family)